VFLLMGLVAASAGPGAISYISGRLLAIPALLLARVRQPWRCFGLLPCGATARPRNVGPSLLPGVVWRGRFAICASRSPSRSGTAIATPLLVITYVVVVFLNRSAQGDHGSLLRRFRGEPNRSDPLVKGFRSIGSNPRSWLCGDECVFAVLEVAPFTHACPLP